MEIYFCNNEEDIKLICKSAKEIYFEHYGKLLSQDFIDYWVQLYQSYENISKSIANGEKYFFVKNDKEIAGYFSYILQPDNKLFISKLYIKSNYRNNSFGTQCLNYLQDIAIKKQVKAICLKTMRKNPSLNFYIKNGFKITDTVETDLGNNYILEDYILSKTIK